jgi:hypothetical protein
VKIVLHTTTRTGQKSTHVGDGDKHEWYADERVRETGDTPANSARHDMAIACVCIYIRPSNLKVKKRPMVGDCGV